MREEVVVGVDFGSSRIKAAAYAGDGRLVAACAIPTPLRSGADGDDFLVGEMLDAAAAAVGRLGLPRGSIAGLGTSSMGEVGTVLTADGLVDLAFPSWYDRRGGEIVERIERAWGAHDLRIATGNHARLASTVAKLGHLARSQELPRGTFLGLCGAFAWQLTGGVWQEAGLAVTSGAFDILRGRYLEHVWETGGLGVLAVPPVAEPGASRPASTELAGRLGLAPGAPVVIAGHDHPVASVGAGIRRGEVGDSMGTGEAIIAVVRSESAVGTTRLAEMLGSDPYLAVEVWPTTGEPLVVWERMRPGLAMRTFVESAGLDRAVLEREAPESAREVIVTDQASLALEDGRPGGLPPTPAGWAALIDFYVELANAGQEVVRAASGADGATVLTGGGLRSARWRRAKALRGRAPMAVSLVEETVTRGCAAMAGVAAGWWADAEAMPGAARVVIDDDRLADMEAAFARMAP